MRELGLRLTSYSLLFVLTLASGAHAATYYVRNGGDDNADGRSHAAAWATIAKVNAYSFSPGDVVLFHEGDVFSDAELKVDWSGTSSEHAVVGAYYVENGTEKRGFRDQRPVIDGEDERPASRWVGLIDILADRVRVENLAIVNSEGIAIRCYEADSAQVINLVSRNIYDSAIRFQWCRNGLIEGNYVTDAARAWPEDRGDTTKMVRWAASIVAHHRSSRTVIRRNTITNVFGEGINVHHGTANAVIEENVVFGARAVGIYSDAAPGTTIRRNIVIGTTDSDYWRGGDSVGPGIALNNESFHYEGSQALSSDEQSTNNRIYANIVAFTGAGIAFWSQFSGTSYDDTLVANNTFIDNDIQFLSGGKPMPRSRFLNNILYSASTGTKDVSGAVSGLTARNNYFSQGDPGGEFSHDGNRYSGLKLARMSGWRKVSELDQLSWQDFVPESSSSTNGAGTDSHLSLASGADQFGRDFNSQSHNDPFDMGAIRSGGAVTSEKTPESPLGLKARRP